MQYTTTESFCIHCEWVGPTRLMALDVCGYVCEDCEIEASLVSTVRGATLKQVVTAIPAGLPAAAILLGAATAGPNLELCALGAVAGGMALVHAMYSLEAYRTQARLPFRHRLPALERYEPLVVSAVMALVGAASGTIHLLGPFAVF